MTLQTEEAQEQPPVEKEVVQEAVEQQGQEPQKESDKHWENAREAMRLQKEAMMLQKQRIEELEARLQSQAPKPQPETDEVEEAYAALGIDQEDYLTAANARKLMELVAEKKAEKKAMQKIQEYQQQNAVLMDEQRMRSKYDDFDYVIENYAIPMIKNDPALAYKIQNSKNPAEVAYKLAKISDEYEGSSMKQQPSAKAEKILKNSQRPTSGNAANSSLKSQAEDFSKMSPQQTWELSQQYAKRA